MTEKIAIVQLENLGQELLSILKKHSRKIYFQYVEVKDEYTDSRGESVNISAKRVNQVGNDIVIIEEVTIPSSYSWDVTDKWIVSVKDFFYTFYDSIQNKIECSPTGELPEVAELRELAAKTNLSQFDQIKKQKTKYTPKKKKRSISRDSIRKWQEPEVELSPEEILAEYSTA